MRFSKNGDGIYSITKGNCGLGCWIQNTEDGGTWMRKEGSKVNPYGDKTLDSLLILLRSVIGLKKG